MSLQYAVGDATRPNGTGARVIAHVCNDVGKWGRGFVIALSKRWPQPEAAYHAWYSSGGPPPFELGGVQVVVVEQDLWVANMIGQHGIARRGGKPPIRYDALAHALHSVADAALERGASLHMPRIGAGLAGGRWDQIEPLILREVVARGVDATVYDLAG